MENRTNKKPAETKEEVTQRDGLDARQRLTKELMARRSSGGQGRDAAAKKQMLGCSDGQKDGIERDTMLAKSFLTDEVTKARNAESKDARQEQGRQRVRGKEYKME